MTTKSIGEIVSKYGDPEFFGERELKYDDKVVQDLPYGTKIYAHPPVTWPDWKPIATLPTDNPKRVVMAFADYIDESKGIEFRTVASLKGFEQYTYWAEPIALPPVVSKWCECEDCIDLKNHFTTLTQEPK